MLAALEAVKHGTSIKRTSLEHGIPQTTLLDRHLGKVVHELGPDHKAIRLKRKKVTLGLLFKL